MSDIRTLLFTDVVDSTAQSEKLGDAAMTALWAAHDRVARDLLPRWRGREIDKADGLLLMFERVADGVGYALAYHRALAALDTPLEARAGLHVGAVVLRENNPSDVALGAKPLEVEGIAKPTAARVMSLARGGQTLLTAAARAALGEVELKIESHGHWRLKGLAEPAELFEIGDAGSPFIPPQARGAKGYRVVCQGDQWLPADQVRHSLPAEGDAFVGRHDALVELARRFDEGARLVSVVGIGGCGKTRLATRFASSWLGDFPGGAWFCDLAAARSADGIVHAVALALDVPLGVADPVVQLGNVIAGRGDCLVILDNFEQVARHAEETLGRWLSRAGKARFLVTSREVLGLAGEETFALAPMPAADAAELFLRRAEAAKRDFVPSEQDRAAIAPLVKLLDGLPLAIELAAARVRVMPPHTLLARMSERFKLLSSTGGRRDRQATLRATFDWSWGLLADGDKAALAQLSVFEGRFTLRAVEALLELPPDTEAPWAIDVMQSLVNKSFVRRIGERFDLLGTVQEYAGEHLRSAGRYPGSGPQAHEAAQARHGAFFATLDEKEAIADGCADLDNLVAACRRAVERGDAPTAVRALENAWAAVGLRGPFRFGIELAAQVRDMPGLAAAQRARAECVAGIVLEKAGRSGEARTSLETALFLAREARDRRCEARVLGNLGYLFRSEGRTDERLVHLTEALTLAHEIQDRTLQCELHNGLGTFNYEMGRLETARTEYEAALALARSLGDRRWEGGVLGNLANLHADLGHMDEARSDYEDGLAAAREIGHRQWEGNMLCNLGFLLLTQRRLEEARSHFEAALAVARDMGHARLECVALGNLGIVLDSLGCAPEAQGQFEAALVIARQIGEHRFEGQFLGYLGLLHARQGRPQEARRCLDSGEALLRSVSDRLSMGVLLCGRAEAEQHAGDTAAARVALVEARALAIDAGSAPESELGQALVRVAALLDCSATA